jgi:hypothetical protein
MAIFEEHLEVLKAQFPGSDAIRLPSGAYLVTVPGVKLPAGGWNKTETYVRFIAPVAYPQAKPDCFWADPELRLGTGGMPQSSNISAIPETNEQHLWFSWHTPAGGWDPNRDNLNTYTNVVRNRLKEVR